MQHRFCEHEIREDKTSIRLELEQHIKEFLKKNEITIVPYGRHTNAMFDFVSRARANKGKRND